MWCVSACKNVLGGRFELNCVYGEFLFASAGIRGAEGVVLIVSADHRESVKIRLQLEGIDTEVYERSGQLACVGAEEPLAKFTAGGILDEHIFKSTIGRLIEDARTSVSTGPSGKVRVFGEMVSQMRGKDLKATTRLEELWNEVIVEHSVSLLCTYALHGAADRIPEELLGLPSHNIEREFAVA